MSVYDRMRSLGVSEERLAVIGVVPEQAPTIAEAAASPDLATAQSDIAAWRSWKGAEGNPFLQSSLRAHLGEAIERGKALEAALPVQK